MTSTFSHPGGTAAHYLKIRYILLFYIFFIGISAGFQVNSASHSLRIEHGGPRRFPRVWNACALVLGSFIGCYCRLVKCYSRLASVPGSALMLLICSAWAMVLALLAREYHGFINRQPAIA